MESLEPGCTVKIHGLRVASQLNGHVGLLGCFDKLSARWHVKLHGIGTKALLQENIMVVQSVSLNPCSLSVDEDDRKFAASLIPGNEKTEHVVSCLDAVSQVARQLGAKCVLFGSWAQQTALPSSDLDIALLFKHHLKGERCDCHAAKIQLLESVVVRAAGNNQIRLLNKIFQAKVPILRFEYYDGKISGSSLEFDLSVGKSTTGMLDDYIRDALANVPRCSLFVRLVKFWTQQRSIGKSYHGCMNASCWTLLVLFFTKTFESASDPFENIRIAFVRFLMWLQGLAVEQPFRQILSVREGRFLPCVDSHNRTLLWVEDPTSTSNNIAHSVRPEGWQAILKELDRALALLRKGDPLSVVCEVVHTPSPCASGRHQFEHMITQQQEQNDVQEARKRLKTL